MQTIDQLNVAAVLVAVVGSVIAVAVYEPDTGAQDFAIAWPTDQFAVQGANEQHTGAGEVTVAVIIPHNNVSKIAFEITVTVAGPRVQAQTFTVSASGPGIAPATATGSIPAGATEANVVVPLEVAVADVPTNESISAADEESAVAELNRTSGSDVGSGLWEVVISFAASGRPGPAAESHDVDVLATAHVWRAQVTPDLPEVEAQQ